MRKQVEITIPNLFNLQPSVKERIYEQLKKDKRTTVTIMAKKIKSSETSTRRSMESLVSEGKIKDLGVHYIGKRNNSRVYEIA